MLAAGSHPTEWKRSRFCADGFCVEVAVNGDGSVLVRNARFPDGPVLTFAADSWTAFLSGVSDGHFADW